MTSIKRYIVKLKIKELIKYDLGLLGIFPSVILTIIAIILFYSKKQILAYKVCGNVFRSNWYGSVVLPKFFLRLTFGITSKRPKAFERAVDLYLTNYPVIKDKEKFFNDPSKLLISMMIVIRPWTPEHKGILIIKYSYYFPLFLKLFHSQAITPRYHIVLEPSWAGYLDLSILSYCTLHQPVFVMTYEERDEKLITSLNSNLKSIDVGPNWWVDYENFKPNNVERDIDVIMVASWSSFKRHYFVLKALSKLRSLMIGRTLKVVFVGYDGDLTREFVKKMIANFNLTDVVDLYDTIPSEQVANLLQRSKVNLLWSRFEGNNRSIIEGLFCDTPIVIKKGHNFGYTYPYINSKTGLFTTEEHLATTLESIINKKVHFSPREYVLQEHNYNVALKRIEAAIQKVDSPNPSPPKSNGKINHLWGMKYSDEDSLSKYDKDYQFLRENIIIE